MFDYRLSLMTGIDIPIVECQFAIHQPTIKEISYIGEKNFLIAVQLLCLNKTMYVEEQYWDKVTNFEIFMTLLNSKNSEEDIKEKVKTLLSILIPNAEIIFIPRTILVKIGEQNFNINEDNFESLQQVLRDIFCLKNTDQNTYNPANKKAKEIADKLMKGRKKVAELNDQKGSMFGQYLSIIAIGIQSMSLKDTFDLTMYQLYDLIERYNLYLSWDIDLRSRLTFGGSSDNKPLENWMKQIH